ncbi:hypothetical protein TVAG_239400 [Trichomonas vaginalis G3]|uniref:Longin domain-containing protein n=1 Tax=Trichomonas vaginalis (strain ATCC PRA-98 / G3) TaxID=412133 RepID=A2DGH0_TRIV3|nr:vesicle-associated membrane protein 9 family [Trichomonas vaginalis G3]EAY20566.1 hypothetical protein TVAG_239400 [Trichomonas vaginalis G3]KAI5488239.1 vesicle-associated membrane protein 9 family [Trichomonas vaginalis G3]|eukprot:XP_001581552.1 hypothetical protein [Trichomonas vaginalis G3]
MDKKGLFRYGAVSHETKVLTQHPRGDFLVDNDINSLLNTLEKSFPISVIEKQSRLYTIRSDKTANYIVMTDKSVDTASCGAFLSDLKKLWNSFSAIEENVSKEDSIPDKFDGQIKDLIEKYNKDRIEDTEDKQNDIPEIILDEHKLPTIDPDPVVTLEESREEPLLGSDATPDLTITFNQEHYDESLTHLRIKICWQRHKITILIALFVIIVSIVIILIACGGFNIQSCISHQKGSDSK